MSSNPKATFDVGPLSWVKTEIEHSLSEARSHLDVLAAEPGDVKSIKYIATHLHQVTGALSMVALGAATRFNEEIEKLVATFENPDARGETVSRIAVIKSATASLSAYLDNLMAGEADRPMMLASAYLAVNKARGATDAAESDLFSPDLSVAIPMPEDTIALPKSDAMVAAIKHRRSMYQTGLLKLLRDKDLAGGAREMRNATLAIEALQVTSPTRSFWYTASGFFDAIASNPADAGALAVQLFGKIDQQIKLLIEGVQKVPEKLFRDLLLVIGKSKAQTERLKKIRELYRLDELLALPDVNRDSAADDQLKTVLRAMRERLQVLKDHWLKFTTGNRPALEPFSIDGEALVQDSLGQPNKDLSQLLHVIATAGAQLRKSAAPLTESQGLEVATALLFAESSLENYFRLSTDFAAQVVTVTTRVQGALAGATLAALDPSANPLMDDITKRAQERMLIFQVGQEVQVNLTTIETALDNYFRDPTRTGELSPLLPLFSQVQGALSILELDEAAGLNQVLRERVSQFASGAMRGVGDDAESLAEGISALGLYVTALQQGSTDPRSILMPALIRFGLASKPVEAEKSMLKSPVTAGDVDVAKQKVQALYEDWKHQPEATATRDQLRDAVKELKQEAELIADTKSAKFSEEALKAIDATFDPMKVGMSEALHDIAPEKPTATPAQQTVQLMNAPASEVDQELLEIFLEEATEVVGTIRENLDIIRASPHERESLTTIRRGYHTLKGSGRMVGLNDLGEVAWNCEQALNKWLKDEKPASSSLMLFIDYTSKTFGEWVGKLQQSGIARIDGAEISRMAELIKNDKEIQLPQSPSEASDSIAAPSTVDVVPAAPVAVERSLSDFDLPSLDLDLPATGTEDKRELPDLAIPAMASAAAVVGAAASVAAHDDKVTTAAEFTLDAPSSVSQPEIVSSTTHSAAAASPPEIRIGSISLPAPFFDIYIEEAKMHIATLENEMFSLESNAMRPVSHEFMRAAHTLTSSSRTTGFTMIADVAHALEKWLQDAIDVPPSWTPRRLSVTGQSVEALSAMVRGLVSHDSPTPRPDLEQELKDLRTEFADARRIGEGTNLSKPLKITQKLLVIPEIENALPDVPPPLPVDTDALTKRGSDDYSADFDFFDEPSLTSKPATAAHVEAAELAEKAAEAARLEAAEIEAAKIEAAKVEAARLEAERVEAEKVEAARIEAERVEAEKVEAARIEAERIEAVKVETAQAEARAEAERIRVAKIEAERIEAAKVEAEKAEAAKVEAARIEAEKAEAAKAAAAKIAAAAALASFAAASAAAARAAADSAPNVLPITEAVIASVAPASAALFESGRDRRTVQDDIDPDLLPIFLEEAQEIVPQVGDALRRWRATPVNHAPVTELARHLHTLKGSARMAGLMRLGELAHVMETDIIAMEAEAIPATIKFDKIDEGLDRFNAALDRIAKGDLVAPIEIPVATQVSEQLPAPLAKLAAARAEIVAEGEKLEGRERQALLRVNADMIDRFVNEAGELAIARSRIDLEMIAFKRALLELSENVNRMKVQLREIEIQAETQIQSRTKEQQEHGGEFDPLEFDRFSRMQENTRFLAESLNDVVTLQQSLNSNIDETEAALLQQARLNRDLQQGLMGVRLVPLGNLQDRFYRLVRQTAKELDKKANLEFRGVRVEIDRSVLEKITGPFEHLLRNAVSHGLEMPGERVAKGKSEIGEITIDARQAGNEIMLTLSDDGGGLNFERIREKAIQQGLLAANDEVTEAQLTQYIFMAGFSTADEVTQISGRGVGMDVVRSEIVSLGGRIDISSTPGRGTSFTIALPLTLAVTQAVMVVVNDTTYAIPSVMIEQVQEYKGKRYEPLLEMNEIDWKGNKYPLRSMEAILGGKPTISAQRKASVILAKSGQQRAAVQVDEIIGNREIVVKNIGPQLARLVGVAGATVMGSGQVILILNPVQLVFREAATVKVEKAVGDTRAAEQAAGISIGYVSAEAAPAVEAELMKGVSLAETIAANMFDEGGFVKEDLPTLARTIPLVMVVDDSLTVRKITSRMLTREGFEVATAKDGVDGLQQLQDIQPDIILLDIEMPRMDGFEFARNVRADAKARDIPIIMITSRTADKHRNRAMELGVNEYMGKPYQEEQLLAMIRSYTKHITAAKK
jgi:chemosensory pili system protein ChpA (sensor histidine kinase/response regulator)